MPETAAQTPLEAASERVLRARYAQLTAHYGEIGSAALVAALICAQRKEETGAVSRAA